LIKARLLTRDADAFASAIILSREKMQLDDLTLLGFTEAHGQITFEEEAWRGICCRR
jgi:hypothetical protein